MHTKPLLIHSFSYPLFMANLLMLSAFIAISLAALNGEATVYNVGDSADWDISADFPSWISNKTFYVGDVLLFQYSKYHTVNEVDKASYESCNTTSAILMGSDGNTSIPLSSEGDRHFVCGVVMHCLGGMKLQVHVDKRPVISPAGAPLPPLEGSPFTKSDESSSPPFIGSSSSSSSSSAHFVWSCALLQVLYWCLL